MHAKLFVKVRIMSFATKRSKLSIVKIIFIKSSSATNVLSESCLACFLIAVQHVGPSLRLTETSLVSAKFANKSSLTSRRMKVSNRCGRKADLFYCSADHYHNGCMCKMNTVIHIHLNRPQCQIHHHRKNCAVHQNLQSSAMILACGWSKYKMNELIRLDSDKFSIRFWTDNLPNMRTQSFGEKIVKAKTT